MESIKHSPTVSILIVDDDEETSRIIGLIIGKKFPSATVSIAENGKKGLDLFRDFRQDIVITDIRMPVMDGIEMAREIKLVKSDTPIIVLTAFTDKELLAAFEEIGFSDFITKPIDFIELLARIEKCIAEIVKERP